MRGGWLFDTHCMLAFDWFETPAVLAVSAGLDALHYHEEYYDSEDEKSLARDMERTRISKELIVFHNILPWDRTDRMSGK